MPFALAAAHLSQNRFNSSNPQRVWRKRASVGTKCSGFRLNLLPLGESALRLASIYPQTLETQRFHVLILVCQLPHGIAKIIMPLGVAHLNGDFIIYFL
jgi:hypothetical protein